ncbi:ABC transporter substrate-binding protein [Rhodococcus baikonurensis]|uniref:ABC transporter substrate-binding protein n=1 Tax=Rhodococcus baikonurensis TaxID=172041 RepID=UPI00379F1F8D
MALAADPQCIDPHQVPLTEALHVGRQLVDNLTYQDPQTGDIRPWIATSWNVSDESKRFTFNIRDGATFSNGEPVDAAAVAANIEDLHALGAKSPIGASYTVHFVSAEASDSHTVVVTFDSPSSQFLQATSMVTTGLLAPETLRQTPEERCTQIIGSGPFALESFQPNSAVKMVARPDYDWAADGFSHTGRSASDGIEFLVMPESGVRSGGLQSEQIDVDTDVQAQDEKVNEGQGLVLLSRPRSGMVYTLLPNEQSPRLADARVRNAISRGIDRKAFSDLLSSRETYSTSVLSASTPGYVDHFDSLSYDPGAAASALDAAGWSTTSNGIRSKDGEPLTLRFVFASTDARSNIYQLVQQQLRAIGVDLQLVPLASGANTEAQKSGDYDIVCWSLTRPDPEVLSTIFGVRSSNPNKRTDAGAIDLLLDQLAATTESESRLDIASAASREIIEQGHGIPLFEQSSIIGVSPDLDGVVLDASSRPNFYGARINR